MSTSDNRPIAGGPAQPVYLLNQSLPASGEGDQPQRVTLADVNGNPISSFNGTANQGAPGVQPWLVSGIVALDTATRNALAPLSQVAISNSPVVLDPMAYFASAAGGRVAFNISTAVVNLSGTGEQPLAALVNPSGSNEDMVLDIGEFGCSTNATFRRYRNAIITPTGTPREPTNTGGGSATSAARMYVGGTTPTYTRSGGLVAKDAFIQGYATYFTYLRGRSVLRPGQSLSWTIQLPQGQSGNAFTASVYIEYYKRTAEA